MEVFNTEFFTLFFFRYKMRLTLKIKQYIIPIESYYKGEKFLWRKKEL